MKSKCRFIELCIKQHPEYSKKEIYARIMAGECIFNREKIRNPSMMVSTSGRTEIVKSKYISRGGYKLEGPLQDWEIDVKDKIILDAGASTGGFTHCLLKHKAAFVHAVDVGYNQLDYRLRLDERVNVLERTNIMEIQSLHPMPHWTVADLSFRSITGAAKHIIDLTKESWGIFLIKPQFEAASLTDMKLTHDFNGIIRDPGSTVNILTSVAEKLSQRGIGVQKIFPSPVPGKKGNREFFFLLSSRAGDGEKIRNQIEKAVEASYRSGEG
jgi:23S rRNA (cytidine1920-2'-O)/16S rRNA (cytidine1409-2'-O)-methyltransferase